MLAQRLRHLLDHGIVERRPYSDRPVRYEYVLTDKGWELCDILVAITAWGDRWTAGSDGPPVLLNTGEAPTFADPQAAITWASSLQTGIKTDIKLKNFIGRGSGESVQMAFTGQGWVLVQPSEGRMYAAQSGGGGGGGLLGNLTG